MAAERIYSLQLSQGGKASAGDKSLRNEHISYRITGVPQASELKELRAREGTAHLDRVFWRRRGRGHSRSFPCAGPACGMSLSS